MTEINNNNISKYSAGADRIAQPQAGKDVLSINIPKEPELITNYVQDTGVLGRSQIVNPKGSDITKSVNEAVNLANNNHVLMSCSETIFNKTYEDALRRGLSSQDAYTTALMAEEEFMKMGQSA
ncbi:MAG: hypothetical protein LUG16_05585 [Candidatus Gastranaerophilales bacterium]|nr:hypothetical protein [Candidatus Gastranaerophilales bacterium]